MRIADLKKMRLKAKVTQKQLSRHLRKNPTFICKLEAGKRMHTKELREKIQTYLESFID